MRGTPWTHDEIIAAYALYCVTPLQKIRPNNPMIQKAAKIIHHSAPSICMRMNNFMAIDPDSGKDGCAHVAKADKEIYQDFKHDWFTLCNKAEKFLGFDLFASNESTPPPNKWQQAYFITYRAQQNQQRKSNIPVFFNGRI